jgi:DNA-directed RNA polymerase subunit M/transcription elongation factor TFIIS
MPDKLVTIANFAFTPDPVSQAELAKIKLEAEGIRCFLSGKNFIGIYWLCSAVAGGVKLQVKKSDAKRALKILQTDEKVEIEALDNNLTPEPIDGLCPKCHSDDIAYHRFSRTAFYLGILFFRVPLPLSRRSYKCNDCGHTWKER